MRKTQYKKRNRWAMCVLALSAWLSSSLFLTTPAKAIPIGTDPFFWCFDVTGLLSPSEPLVNLTWTMQFTGDLFDDGEVFAYQWLDELTDTYLPISSAFNSGPSVSEFTHTIGLMGPSPTDDDIYLGLNMQVDGGTLNVTSVFISELSTNSKSYENLHIAGNPVPEPATMLLLGTGLVGLAGTRIRKRLKK